VVFGVDAHDVQVAGRAASVAVAAGHTTPLGHVTGELRLPDRAGQAVHLLHTVRSTLAGHVVADHDARGAAPLGGADDVDLLDALQHFDIHGLANSQFANRAAELADKTLRFAAGLGSRFHAGLGL